MDEFMTSSPKYYTKEAIIIFIIHMIMNIKESEDIIYEYNSKQIDIIISVQNQSMLRVAAKLARGFSYNFKLPPSTSDMSNMAAYLNSSSTPSLSFFQKISHFSPYSMYESFDLFTRELLFTLANDYKLALPASVILISLMIRGIFFYPTIKGQIAALKMKQIKPALDRFKEKSRLAQMTGNMSLMRAARDQLKDVQKKKGIDNFYMLLNVLQIPFLITWFLSLRYIAAMPQIYPSVTQGFLWMDDLSTYDPYFLLPIISALLTSYSIAISPALKNNSSMMPLLQPFMKYLKYLPILSLPIVGFFPAIINVYWCTMAFAQTFIMLIMNTKYIQSHVNTQEIVKPQVVRAIFVQEKPKLNHLTQSKIKESKKDDQIHQQEKKILNDAEDLKILSKKPKKQKKNDK